MLSLVEDRLGQDYWAKTVALAPNYPVSARSETTEALSDSACRCPRPIRTHGLAADGESRKRASLVTRRLMINVSSSKFAGSLACLSKNLVKKIDKSPGSFYKENEGKVQINGH